MGAKDHGTMLLQNSIRLFKDARMLLENGRHPSATALAILSLEEFGKFIAAIGLVAGPSLDKRLHIKKQTDISVFVLRYSYVLSVADHFNIRVDLRGAFANVLGVDHEHMTLFEDYLRIDESKIDIDEFGKIIRSPLMGHALRLFTMVYNGDLNLMKNRALYADVAPDGTAYDPVVEITPDKAKAVIDLCSHVLSFFGKRVLASPETSGMVADLGI